MSRLLLRHRSFLLPGARSDASHPFTAASSSSRSSYTSRFSPLAYHASAAATAAGAQSEGAAAESTPAAGDQPSSTPPPAARGRWGLLKFGALAAVAGAIGGVGYVTYAYSLNEVEEKTREFRKNPRLLIPEDASTFEKYKAMVYSTAMKVPVSAIELYLDIRSTIEDHVRGFTEPTSDKLLPDLLPQDQHVFTLVLDLNETLVYSDWQRERGWRTFKRPGVDAFLEHMSKLYEVVVYSDQPPMYVEPVFERLNSRGTISHRLSRPATKYVDGKHYRDLSKLNRNPAQVIYLSAHALESCLQHENCVEIKPFKLEDKNDTQLLDLIPFLEYVAMARPSDIRTVLASYQGHDVAAKFIERSKEHQRRVQEQSKLGRLWRR
ncbi:import inner membrane translocase subunit TIM50 [Zea mays]|uniref:Mitochondrial import inner membrane translocase subunit TIM50 n=1 Tax=Zea mays TaxID=4577 RepID=B4FBH4_MAIZE|nr:import inner membrane translocase subunit TIM50 [Zea mays]ACF79467.1 unknown [Zea mays]ACG44899.1 import inner membrane translocase subunit TIM50 [Zea mays]ACN29084.1 unknown [Zea mays]AQK94761.1 Mitochondrial import inner membrane translocase subunit TIM50 [Zea mays]|eukprot:NP_001131167.1 import inner membrane translocase subunit TIM50 [Zea mays]